MAEPSGRRRSFGPVVLAGLATAGLAAVASAKPWIGGGSGGGDATLTAVDTGVRSPVASAVALVLLATWGVLLVTRGVVRRTFALLAALAAVGLVVAVVVGHQTLPDQAGSSFDQLIGRSAPDTGFTGWFWTAAVASVLALVPAALAVRLVGEWPEMGSRYDAPAAARQDHVVESDRDLWKELDEGRDPTA